MHSAPAVSYPVGRSSMRALLLLLPLTVGGVVGLLWVGQAERPGLVHGWALLAWGGSAVAVFLELRRPCQGLLRWDGQEWRWETAGHGSVGTVRVRLDWQRGLLLEFRHLDGAVSWLWPERQTAPLQWDALRRAVYAPWSTAKGLSQAAVGRGP